MSNANILVPSSVYIIKNTGTMLGFSSCTEVLMCENMLNFWKKLLLNWENTATHSLKKSYNQSINQSLLSPAGMQPANEGLWDTVATKHRYIKVYRNEKRSSLSQNYTGLKKH